MAVTDEYIVSVLNDLDAYVTRTRVAVFRILADAGTSLNVQQIQKRSASKLDRVSIYRTLRLFMVKKLVRVVPNSLGSPYYILDKFGKSRSRPLNSPAVSFLCIRCSSTQILDENSFPFLPFPPNHEVQGCYIVFEGICQGCLQSKLRASAAVKIKNKRV